MTPDLDLLPAGVRELAERRDALLGTLEASSVSVDETSPMMLIHVDSESRTISEFGIARITDDRAVLSAFADPPDALKEAEIIGALIEAIKSRRLLEQGWLRIERVLRPETPYVPAETVTTYERLGFEFFYTEHELHRDLDSPSDTPTPDGITIVPWTRERDAELREAYNDAFRDRGVPAFDEAAWETFSAQAASRADLTLLALDGDTIAGFCLCADAEDGSSTAWITNVGVRPRYRARGVASALIVQSMRAMHDAGLAHAALRVNENNARARRLYDRLGFRPMKKHIVYRKQFP